MFGELAYQQICSFLEGTAFVLGFIPVRSTDVFQEMFYFFRRGEDLLIQITRIPINKYSSQIKDDRMVGMVLHEVNV
jgi:hypothetical protein